MPDAVNDAPPDAPANTVSAPGTLYLPAIEGLKLRIIGSPIRQLRRPAGEAVGVIEPIAFRSVRGNKFILADDTARLGPILIVPKKTSAGDRPELVLVSASGLPTGRLASSSCRWQPPRAAPPDPDMASCEAESEAVRHSWRGAFQFKAEQRAGSTVTEKGLRPPQIGALHAVLAHWSVSTEPATVVMPTGTGKTETMLAVLVSERLHRLLVIVPTDALREQLTNKFLSLGILQAASAVTANARLPIVGMLVRKPRTVAEADDFFRRCNVIVTTAQIAGDCTDAVSRRIASLCSHLFVDEAHHIRAPTWERIRSSFAGKPVLQFTATPYRGDGKLVDGKMIYNYPLRKAQAEGYFRPIKFRSIEEYDEDKSDERIAQAAIEQLEADIAAGLDHLLLARCSGIRQAERLYVLYGRLAAKHNPVLAHSKLNGAKRRDAVHQLRTRQSRIVVCVDMFGEGFDLPELKIAALHDVHKSLAVTLQFLD